MDDRILMAPLHKMSFAEFVAWVVTQMKQNGENVVQFEIPGMSADGVVREVLAFDIRLAARGEKGVQGG